MLKESGDVGTEWLIDICNSAIRKYQMIGREAYLFLFTKEKVFHLNVGYIEQFNFLSITMKVFERVLEIKIREQVKIDDRQLGFTHGKVQQMPFL